MANIYINVDTGNDSTGDGSLSTPYKTISKAFSVASTDDVIIGAASATVYPWSTDVNLGSLGITDITLQGDTYVGDPTTNNFIIDAQTPYPEFIVKENFTIKDLVIQNHLANTSYRRSVINVVNTNSAVDAVVTVQRCRIQDCTVYTATSSRGGFIGQGSTQSSAPPFNSCTINLEQVELCNVKGDGSSYAGFISLSGTVYANATNCSYYADATGNSLRLFSRVGNAAGNITAATHRNWNIKHLHTNSMHFGDATSISFTGGVADLTNENISLPSGYTSVIDADPMYVDASNYILELLPDSPAHNAGV